MNVLLLRPIPANERFGLGPFFRIEPLGMEYIAAALEARGHHVTLADLRFTSSVAAQVRASRPRLVGIAAMHALETDDVVDVVRRVKTLAPEVPIIVGGHTAAAYPEPFLVADTTAVVLDDGERTLPLVCDALDRGAPLTTVPGLALRGADGELLKTAGETEKLDLDAVPLPARHHVEPWRRQYACLAHRPAYLVETARGCPFRCSFCSIWQLHARAVRDGRLIGLSTSPPWAITSSSPTISSGTIRRAASRSRRAAAARCAEAMDSRQSRTDPVARHPELLEAWRPIAHEFDIFFGLEAATDDGLKGLTKDATVGQTEQAIAIARGLGFGVTGNFVIDPAWTEGDFQRLWDFVDRNRLHQAGFTILTPLPGTTYFEEMRPRVAARKWAHFDMHHLLWEPALGPRRFFELYCETWRRSVLNLKGRKGLIQWMREVDLSNAMFLMRALRRTQRLMDAGHYMHEYDLAPPLESLAAGRSSSRAAADDGAVLRLARR